MVAVAMMLLRHAGKGELCCLKQCLKDQMLLELLVTAFRAAQQPKLRCIHG